MRLRLSHGAGLALAVATVAGSAVSARAAAGCVPAGDTVIAASTRAAVYSSSGTVFGCDSVTRHTVRLGSVGVSCLGTTGRVASVTVTGRLVGYSLTQCGVDVISARVVVRDLATGRAVVSDPAATVVEVEGLESVGKVVLASDGAVAWTVQSSSIVAHRTVREVIAARGSRERVLATGPRIGLRSLRLKGSTLSWADGTRTSRASLP